MSTNNQISPGTTLSIDGKIYRVESSVRVNVPKGVPFIKTKLRNLMTDRVTEKNFKIDQVVNEVSLSERRLEYLYLEGKSYLFLDIDQLEQVVVSPNVVQDKVDYLKEGIQIKAMFYGETIFSIELPQFLELMVVKLKDLASKISISNASKIAVLETGAEVEVPLFVEMGDVVKVDTQINEYVQRI